MSLAVGGERVLKTPHDQGADEAEASAGFATGQTVELVAGASVHGTAKIERTFAFAHASVTGKTVELSGGVAAARALASRMRDYATETTLDHAEQATVNQSMVAGAGGRVSATAEADAVVAGGKT
jgi:hypothetical protein